MPFDLKAWLKEVGVDDASVAVLEPHLSKPEVLGKVQSSVMRTVAYKKSQDAIAKLQTEIAEKDRLLDADYAKLGETRADMDKTFQKVKKERDALATKANGIIAKVKTAFEANGLDADELGITEIDDFEPNSDADDKDKNKRGRQQDFDASGLMTKKEFDEKLTLIVRGLRGTMDTGAELLALDQEHRELFSKPLPSPKLVMKEYLDASAVAARANKPEPSLREFTEARFKFAERREEVGAVSANLTKAELDALIKRKEEEAVIKARNNERTPLGDGGNKPGGSKILQMRESLSKERPAAEMNAARERRGVDKAIASYDTIDAELAAKR